MQKKEIAYELFLKEINKNSSDFSILFKKGQSPFMLDYFLENLSSIKDSGLENLEVQNMANLFLETKESLVKTIFVSIFDQEQKYSNKIIKLFQEKQPDYFNTYSTSKIAHLLLNKEHNMTLSESKEIYELIIKEIASMVLKKLDDKEEEILEIIKERKISKILLELVDEKNENHDQDQINPESIAYAQIKEILSTSTNQSVKKQFIKKFMNVDHIPSLEDFSKQDSWLFFTLEDSDLNSDDMPSTWLSKTKETKNFKAIIQQIEQYCLSVLKKDYFEIIHERLLKKNKDEKISYDDIAVCCFQDKDTKADTTKILSVMQDLFEGINIIKIKKLVKDYYNKA